MSYVTVKEALSSAQKGMYAVGAFNVENMEMAQSVIAAAEATHAPVILQTTPRTLKHAAPKVLPGWLAAWPEITLLPVSLNLILR